MQDKELKVLLIEDNPGDARLVREMLSEAEGGPYQLHWSETLLDGLGQLSQTQFDVAILDLSLPDSNGLDTFTTVRTHAPRVPLVLLTGLDNDALAAQAVERGAQDYLVKGKLDGESLARALRYAVLRNQKGAPEETPNAKVLGVVGSKGGVGTTTFACHFAMEWRRQTQQTTLLMDLDADSASSGFLLKSESGYSILDASTNLHRLDAQLWKGMVWPKDGLEIVQPPGHVRLGDHLSGDRLRHVLRFVRTAHEAIIIDLCRYDALTIGILDEVQELFLVTTAGVQSLYESKRVLQSLTGLGMRSADIHLVLNRIHKHALVSRPEVEKALGIPVFAHLPYSESELEEAYADGKTLPESDPLYAAVAQSVAKARGAEYKPPQRRKLFSF